MEPLDPMRDNSVRPPSQISGKEAPTYSYHQNCAESTLGILKINFLKLPPKLRQIYTWYTQNEFFEVTTKIAPNLHLVY